MLENNSNTVALNTNFNTGYSTKIGSGHNVHAGRRYMDLDTIDDLQVSYEAKYSSSFSPQINVETSSSSIFHFDFNQGTGNTLSDLSGNGNNGTIYGASWSRIMRIMDVLIFMLQIMMKMQIIMLVVNLNKTLILSCIQSTQGEIL